MLDFLNAFKQTASVNVFQHRNKSSHCDPFNYFSILFVLSIKKQYLLPFSFLYLFIICCHSIQSYSMSHQQTKFLHLPNEVICCIFDFLTSWDILRVFTRLNRRYDELVRFYVKEIDLSDDGQEIDQQQLQWISRSIQILKVSQFHYSVLNDYQFSQLHSLYLHDIRRWYDIISKMNLKSLKLLSEDNGYYNDRALIPQTLTRFSANNLFHPNNFHANLTHLDVNIKSMTHLTSIAKHTPNVVHLSVVFHENYSESSRSAYDPFHCDKTKVINYRLMKLTFLSIRTK